MEEKMIKNFDRTIEQRLNESAVTPPFGMWNRISAELDNVAPVAVPTTPLIPRGTVVGFIAGASLISLLTAGMLFYNNNYNQPENKVIATVTSPVVEENKLAVSSEVVPVVVINDKKEEIVPVVSYKKVSASKTDTETKPVAENKITYTGLSNDEIGTPLTNTGQYTEAKTDEPYYFPPVDAVTVETKNTEVVAPVIAKQNSITTVQLDESKIDDSKDKTNYSSDKKIKFKKKKRSSWGYMRVNRIKK